MSVVTDIILQRGQIIVQDMGSVKDVIELVNLNEGIVVNIYDTCDTVAIGDVVMYNPEGAGSFQISVTRYFIIDERQIRGNEGALPP